MFRRHSLTCSLLFTALLAATAAQAQNTPAAPAGQERCYGVALKGDTVCEAGATEPCTGVAAVDHPGDAWKFVPKGSCEQTPSSTSPTRFGQLQPFAAPAAGKPASQPAPQ